MTPEETLVAYGEANGLSGCAYDEDGMCRLRIDNDLAIDLEIRRGDGSVLMQCTLGDVDMNDAGLLAEILSANLYYDSADHPVVALDRYSGEAVLLALVPPEASVETFSAKLDSFADEIDAWTDFLRNPAERTDGESPPVAAPRQDARFEPMSFA